MQSIQRFFRNIYLSATSTQSYPPRLTQTFSSGLGYLYWLLVCTTFISAVGFALMLFAARPQIQAFVSDAEKNLGSMYPDELVLTLSGGELSTNVETPYALDPWFWSSEMLQEEMQINEVGASTHFILIDPTATVEDYPTLDTLILLTRTAAVMRDDNGIRVALYSELDITEPIVLDKKAYMEMVTAVQPFVAMIPSLVDGLMLFLIVLAPFAGAFFHWLWLLMYLLVFTVIVLLLSSLMKRHLSYGQLYHLGLYGITLSVLYSLIATWVPALSSIPFVFTIIFLVCMWMVLKVFPVSGKVLPAKAAKKTAGNSPWDEHRI